MKGKKWKKIILYIIILISLIGLGASIYNIIQYKIDEARTNDELSAILDEVVIEEITESDDDQTATEETNPYWYYMNTSLIDVDFSELKATNADVQGWIQVGGTNINYPFVQGDNNEYYLTHSFSKSYNSAGWVFLDYRNDLSNLRDKNTILYAHGRVDGTMFGSLRDILTSEWLDNTNNHIVKLSTEYENTLWQVFSVYRIPTTSDYLDIQFASNEEFLNFIKMLVDRSTYDFGVSISENDRILTLSTCYNDNEKVVLHAKLIRRVEKASLVKS